MRFNFSIKSLSAVLATLIIVVFAVLTLNGIFSFGGNADSKRLELIRDTIKKAAVQCYAIEGSYPTDLNYLVKNYGIVLNENSYFYHYVFIGSNTMPDVSVIRK